MICCVTYLTPQSVPGSLILSLTAHGTQGALAGQSRQNCILRVNANEWGDECNSMLLCITGLAPPPVLLHVLSWLYHH